MPKFSASHLTVAAPLLAALAAPASAQVSDDVVLEIMRQCARIDDATARLACFDNNIRVGNVTTGRNAVPANRVPTAAPSATTGGVLPPDTSGTTGFGREDIRTTDRFEARAGELAELRARVASVARQGEGTYLLTLEDGALWQISETVEISYRLPRAGSTISIDRASLGSFLMTFDNQRSVRVRRLN